MIVIKAASFKNLLHPVFFCFFVGGLHPSFFLKPVPLACKRGAHQCTTLSFLIFKSKQKTKQKDVCAMEKME